MTESDPLLLMIVVALIALLGLAIGSFLNVVIWRLPRGESLAHPPSACPKCEHVIRKRDNIPVLSWLLLRGRCRDCGAPISPRYPLVEAGTALFFVLVALQFLTRGLDQPQASAGLWALPAFLYLAAVSVALAAIDIDVRRLPDRIVLPSIVVGVVLLAVATFGAGDWGILLRAVIGGAALFAFYFALVLAYPRGMGFGDVKLAALLGLYLGWMGWDALIVGAFAAFLIGGVFAIVLVLVKKANGKTAIPFGPWMLAGAWVGIFLGSDLATGYLALFGLSG
jgi:leader peptidase (prepilin peptidase)/N-methyltransferase